MAEQQLIDYIKKAKEAGQSDEQTRALLYKNGWTESEVGDAFSAMNPPAAVQAQVQTQPQIQPAAQFKPQPQVQPAQFQQPQPQTQPQRAAMPSMQSDVTKNAMYGGGKKSHFAMKLFIVLVILVVIAGAGLYFASQYLNLNYLTSLNVFTPDPKAVVTDMLKKMEALKSSVTTASLTINATDSNKVSEGQLSLVATGESDVSDISTPKGDGTLALNVTIPGSAAYSANIDMVSAGGALYLKIDNAQTPVGFSYPGLDISQLTGKWFMADKDSVTALAGATGTPFSLSDISSISSPSALSTFENLLLTENIFTAKQAGSLVINGQDTYHYLVTIDKNKLEDFINKSVSSESQNGGSGGSSAIPQAVIMSFVNSFVDNTGNINLEMWVGKKDHLLYDTKLEKTFDLSQMFDASINAKLDIATSNFNKAVSVVVPTGAQKIESVILPMLKLQKAEADMDEVGATADSLFASENSYSSLCKNGFLNGAEKTFGSLLTTAVNDMIKQGAKNPTCFGGLQDYCVSTQLADGTFQCVDKTGIVGSVKCVSYKTVCNQVTVPTSVSTAAPGAAQ